MFGHTVNSYTQTYGSSRRKASTFSELSEKKSVEPETVGSRLREFAKSRFKTLTAFGEAVGLAPSRVSDYVNDRNSPNPEQLQRFAEVGLNIHWLLTGDGDMDAPKPTGMQPTDLSDLRSIDARVTVARSLEELTALLLRDIEEQKKQKPEEK